MTTDIFDGAWLGLLAADGREPDDAGYRRQRLDMRSGSNRRMIRFGPWQGAGPLESWVIFDSRGDLLDAGSLRTPRWMTHGDTITYRPSSIRSAAIGDVLGITCVFMPSGFAVGVVPPAPSLPIGTLIAGYPDQEELLLPFWLPKRRWSYMPEALIAQVKGWRTRLPAVDVGADEAHEYDEVMMLLDMDVISL